MHFLLLNRLSSADSKDKNPPLPSFKLTLDLNDPSLSTISRVDTILNEEAGVLPYEISGLTLDSLRKHKFTFDVGDDQKIEEAEMDLVGVIGHE